MKAEKGIWEIETGKGDRIYITCKDGGKVMHPENLCGLGLGIYGYEYLKDLAIAILLFEQEKVDSESIRGSIGMQTDTVTFDEEKMQYTFAPHTERGIHVNNMFGGLQVEEVDTRSILIVESSTSESDYCVVYNDHFAAVVSFDEFDFKADVKGIDFDTKGVKHLSLNLMDCKFDLQKEIEKMKVKCEKLNR